MKLISCYVENYGKIKKTSFDFKDKIAAFCEPNGTGKTTLASFIKAMFYGLDSYRTNSKDFCEREHFYPFDDGKFGGNITFEHNGKTYKIERFFGKKSDTSDTLAVYCNDAPTEEFGKELGKALFGVDRASFERTAFISSDEIEMQSTSDINTKLNRFLQGGEDSNFEKAKEALEKASKEYKKSRTENDLISKEKNKVSDLDEKITNVKKIQAALVEKTEKYKAEEQELRRLRSNFTEAQKRNELLSDYENYEHRLEQITEEQEQLRTLYARYPQGLPTEEEVRRIADCMQENAKYEATLSKTKLTPIEEQKLGKYAEIFINGEPNEERIQNVEKAVERLPEIETQLRYVSEQALDENEKNLKVKFMLPPSETQITQAAEKLESYKRLKKEADALPLYVQEPTSPAPTKKSPALFILPLLLILGGVGLCFVNVVIGIILTLLGVGAGITIALIQKNASAAPTLIQRENVERKRMEDELRDLENAVRAVLLPYGYHSDNGLAFDFACLTQDLEKYSKILEKEEKQQKDITALTERKQNLLEKLSAFFREYQLHSETPSQNLTALKTALNEYRSLKARQALMLSDAQMQTERLQQNKAAIDSFVKRYDLPQADTERILSDVKEAERLQKSIEKRKAETEEFRLQKQITQKPSGEKVALEQLQNEIYTKQAAQSRLSREIDADEQETETLDDLFAEKEQAEERLKEYKEKHALLEDTLAFLEQADNALKERYVKPIKDEFLRYAAALEKTLGEKVVMTRDFQIRFERNGEQRCDKHLSSGQRSLCALCFRLALLEKMYADKKPFLIFDDPFTGLDEAHLKKVKTLLNELAIDTQIVYFTCHESRTL